MVYTSRIDKLRNGREKIGEGERSQSKRDEEVWMDLKKREVNA